MAARRDVKALATTLEDLKVGANVRAGFRSPRYGDFIITATVIRGLERTQLTAGSWLLSTAGKPSKHLQTLEILTPETEVTPEAPAEASA